MSVDFQIFPDRGLAYVSYTGHVDVPQAAEAFTAYRRHPEFRRGQKQLVDMTGLTSVDYDYPAMMKLQARKAEVFLLNEMQTLLVYYAPHSLALDLATRLRLSWDSVDGAVILIQQNETEALRLLGQPDRSISEMLTTAPEL